MRTLNLPRLAVVIGAVTILGYVGMRSLAAVPLAAFEPETGTLSGSATVQTATGASGSGVVKFATATPSPTPAPTATPTPGGKPGASNTGFPAGTSLTIVNGDQTYSTNGQVISGLDIRGYVRVTGANITIKNSIIRGGTKPCTSSNAQNSAPLWVMESATNFVFQDSEIAPSNATACMDGIWATNSTIQRANIHGAVDGVKAYNNVTIRDSYIHDLAYFASDPNQGGGETHNDGVQSYECNANILITGTTIDLANSSGGNAAYQITQDAGQACSNIQITNNWLDGGGCTINVAHKVLSNLTGVSITGNKFGRHQGFGGCTVLLSTKSTLSAYSGNVWEDTGLAIPAPQVHD